MPAIMNCLDESNECRIGGNNFSFKPRQLKYFHDTGIASAIDRLKREDGFILLPDSCEYLTHLKDEDREKTITPEQRKVIEEKRLEGINSYLTNLRRLMNNATISLQRDLDRAGYKYDARIEASKADLHRLEVLAKYQDVKEDQNQVSLDKFKELESRITKGSKV